jgi:hypothetical protein
MLESDWIIIIEGTCPQNPWECEGIWKLIKGIVWFLYFQDDLEGRVNHLLNTFWYISNELATQISTPCYPKSFLMSRKLILYLNESN